MKRDCPKCDGEGTIEVSTSPRFNLRDEQWYPDEETRVCPTCQGAKQIEKPTHHNLYNQTNLYKQQRVKREYKRSMNNTVILAMLRAA